MSERTLNCSEPQFPPLQTGHHERAFLTEGLLGGLREIPTGTQLELRTKCGLSRRAWLWGCGEKRGPGVLSCERLERPGGQGLGRDLGSPACLPQGGGGACLAYTGLSFLVFAPPPVKNLRHEGNQKQGSEEGQRSFPEPSWAMAFTSPSLIPGVPGGGDSSGWGPGPPPVPLGWSLFRAFCSPSILSPFPALASHTFQGAGKPAKFFLPRALCVVSPA